MASFGLSIIFVQGPNIWPSAKDCVLHIAKSLPFLTGLGLLRINLLTVPGVHKKQFVSKFPGDMLVLRWGIPIEGFLLEREYPLLHR